MRYLFSVLVLFLLSSCASQLQYFKGGMPERYDWSEADLKKIQFYLSEDIVLSRSLQKGESVISEGKIRLEEGRQVEEIVIKSGTPGVLAFMPKENRMAISFEKGKNKYLVFGPNSKQNDHYALMAKEWRRGGGKVTYNGKVYHTPPSSAFASLMVDLSKINNTEVRSKTLDGEIIK